jgi:hypothetical protein
MVNPSDLFIAQETHLLLILPGWCDELIPC